MPAAPQPSEWSGVTKPGAHAILLIQINEFHKVHQQADSRFENEQSHAVFRNECPFGTEVPGHVSRETSYHVQNHVAIGPGKQSVDGEAKTAALRNIRHFYGQPPDMAFNPSGK